MMLQAVADKMPETYRFCHLSYHQSSILQLISSFQLLTNEGHSKVTRTVRYFFCLSIQPLLSSTASDLMIGFLEYVSFSVAIDVCN